MGAPTSGFSIGMLGITLRFTHLQHFMGHPVSLSCRLQNLPPASSGVCILMETLGIITWSSKRLHQTLPDSPPSPTFIYRTAEKFFSEFWGTSAYSSWAEELTWSVSGFSLWKGHPSQHHRRGLLAANRKLFHVCQLHWKVWSLWIKKKKKNLLSTLC